MAAGLLAVGRGVGHADAAELRGGADDADLAGLHPGVEGLEQLLTLLGIEVSVDHLEPPADGNEIEMGEHPGPQVAAELQEVLHLVEVTLVDAHRHAQPQALVLDDVAHAGDRAVPHAGLAAELVVLGRVHRIERDLDVLDAAFREFVRQLAGHGELLVE